MMAKFLTLTFLLFLFSFPSKGQSTAEKGSYASVATYWVKTKDIPANKLKEVMSASFYSMVAPSNGAMQVLLEQQSNVVYIINHTDDSVYLPSFDRQILLKMQARNERGIWQDIECYPEPICGRSYKDVIILPNTAKQVDATVYTGNYNTKMRAKLLVDMTPHAKRAKVIYSNEIDASIPLTKFTDRDSCMQNDRYAPEF